MAPRERNKTLTALAEVEPVLGACHAEAQRLQFFLCESVWDAEAVNTRRVRLLCEDPATAPHEGGVLVIDDSGHPKHGTKTDHVARQYLGQVGKVDRGIVVVSSLWADEQAYWPVGLAPYTPACRLPAGERDPAFRTKPQQAADLVADAIAGQIGFRAVVTDCFYGDHQGFVTELEGLRVGFVVAVKPRRSSWTAAPDTRPRPMPPARLGGAARPRRAAGGRSSAASTTVTPRPGGRPTCPCRGRLGTLRCPGLSGHGPK